MIARAATIRGRRNVVVCRAEARRGRQGGHGSCRRSTATSCGHAAGRGRPRQTEAHDMARPSTSGASRPAMGHSSGRACHSADGHGSGSSRTAPNPGCPSASSGGIVSCWRNVRCGHAVVWQTRRRTRSSITRLRPATGRSVGRRTCQACTPRDLFPQRGHTPSGVVVRARSRTTVPVSTTSSTTSAACADGFAASGPGLICGYYTRERERSVEEAPKTRQRRATPQQATPQESWAVLAAWAAAGT